MTDKWSTISEKLQKSLDSSVFKVWITPLLGRVEGHVVHLTAPSAYVAQWVEARLASPLREAAGQVLGMAAEDVCLCLHVADHAPSPRAGQSLFAAAGTERGRAAGRPQGAAPDISGASGISELAPTAPSVQSNVPGGSEAHAMPHRAQEVGEQNLLPLPPRSPLTVMRWRHAFDDFVVGPTNAVAVAAAQDLCRSNGAVETLFVSASPGLGKTHLVHAIGQCFSRQNGSARVGYLTAEDFTTHFVRASRTSQMDAFKGSLRDLDVLLLDDVHFFQGKEKTQNEALATIKSLQARGSRVVLTSSFTPRELSNVDSQLVSHFCSGLLASIDKPTVDMRRAILENKARSYQVLLPDSVADMLANSLHSDVRQLESCLGNLIFKARHLNCQISLELAMSVLSQYAEVESTLDVDSIIALVCQSYGLTPTQLASRSRRSECVLARDTIYYLARKHTDLSLQDIGNRFNRRHSTVIKGIAFIERELQRQTTLGRQVANTLQLIERNARM